MSDGKKAKKEKKAGFFDSIARGKKSSGLEKGDAGISFPTDFQHKTHVTFDHQTKRFQNLPPEWEKILNESGITADEQEQSSGTVIQVLNAAANMKTKGLGRAPRPTQTGGSIAGAPRAPRRYMRALFEFVAEGQTHPCGYGAMSLAAGAVVTLKDDTFNDGWVLVQKSATEIGIVPQLYVEPYTPPELRQQRGTAPPGRAGPPTRSTATSSTATTSTAHAPPPASSPMRVPAASRAAPPLAVASSPPSNEMSLAQLKAMAADMKKASEPTLASICDEGDPNDLYENYALCGEGASGSVYSATVRATQQPVAIKKMELAAQPNEGVLHNEVSIMRKGGVHANIVTFHNAFLVDGFLWVVMELVDGGSLTEVLQHSELNLPDIALLLRDSLAAIAFLHQCDIVHRDIKSDNILVGVSGEIRLTDFGYAAQLTDARPKRSTVVGTAWWMAPEVIDASSQYGKACDVWSFGVMARECWEREPPYMDESQTKALFLIMSKGLPPLDYKRPGMAGELAAVVNACCVREPGARPSAAEVQRMALFQLAPNDRAGLCELAALAKRKRAEDTLNNLANGNSSDDDNDDDEWHPPTYGALQSTPPAPFAAAAPPPSARAPPPAAARGAPPPAPAPAPAPTPTPPAAARRGPMGPPAHLSDAVVDAYVPPPSRSALAPRAPMGPPAHLSDAAPADTYVPPPSRAALGAGGPRLMGPPAHLSAAPDDDDAAAAATTAAAPPPPATAVAPPAAARAAPPPVARAPPGAGTMARRAAPPPVARQPERELPTPARAPPPSVASPAAAVPAPAPTRAGRPLPAPAPARRAPGGAPGGAAPAARRLAASHAATQKDPAPDDDDAWSD